MLRSGRRRRHSEHISVKSAGNIHHAVRMAEAMGSPLNQFVSVNFPLTACSAEAASQVFEGVRERFRKWVTRPPARARDQKAKAAFVWVLENPDGCINAHWLVHVPEGRQADFQARLPRWFEKAGAAILNQAALHVEPVYKVRPLARYLMKGLHPAVAPFYGVRPMPQGWVIGQRAGISRSLGPTQKRALRQAGQYPRARKPIFAPTVTPRRRPRDPLSPAITQAAPLT